MLSVMQFKEFRKEVEAALAPIAEKYGTTVKIGSMSYTSTDFKMPLTFVKKEINGKPYEQVEFEKYCHCFGFCQEDYRKEFTYNGEKFKIVGVKPNAPKYPVLAENAKGEVYKMTAGLVKMLMEK